MASLSGERVAAESAASSQMTPTPLSRTPPHRLSSDASFKMLIPIQPPAVPMMVSTARGSFFGILFRYGALLFCGSRRVAHDAFKTQSCSKHAK